MATVIAFAFALLAYASAVHYRVDHSVPGFGGVLVMYGFVAILVMVGTRSLMLHTYSLATFALVSAVIAAAFAELLSALNRRA